MLLRAPYEVLLLRRSGRSAFAPDAYVFPGGTVDDADYAGAPPPPGPGAQFRASVPEGLPTSEPPVSAEQAGALVRAAAREVLEEAGITVDPRDLVLFSHWITPPTEPRRYNTHFFVAAARDGQAAVADAAETHDAVWIAPQEALERYASGTMHLVYPTIKHLERLARFDSVKELLAFARVKPVLTIMPHSSPAEGFVMPAELEAAW